MPPADAAGLPGLPCRLRRAACDYLARCRLRSRAAPSGLTAPPSQPAHQNRRPVPHERGPEPPAARPPIRSGIGETSGQRQSRFCKTGGNPPVRHASSPRPAPCRVQLPRPLPDPRAAFPTPLLHDRRSRPRRRRVRQGDKVGGRAALRPTPARAVSIIGDKVGGDGGRVQGQDYKPRAI